MALGTPMLRSTGYNKNGYLGFLHTRVKAYHLGANGYITPELKYTALASYRQSWGTHFIPTTKVIDNVSYMIELNYSPTKYKGWTVGVSFAQDCGDLYGNNTAGGIKLTKSGKIF